MDQLSTVSQRSSLSVAGAKEVVKTVLTLLRSIKHESHFDMLWEKMNSFVSKHDLQELQERRQHRSPRQLELDMGLTGARGHTFSTKELHQKTHFEAIDVIVLELQQQFEQPGFKTYEIRINIAGCRPR